jgi:hypothetical protein
VPIERGQIRPTETESEAGSPLPSPLPRSGRGTEEDGEAGSPLPSPLARSGRGTEEDDEAGSPLPSPLPLRGRGTEEDGEAGSPLPSPLPLRGRGTEEDGEAGSPLPSPLPFRGRGTEAEIEATEREGGRSDDSLIGSGSSDEVLGDPVQACAAEGFGEGMNRCIVRTVRPVGQRNLRALAMAYRGLGDRENACEHMRLYVERYGSTGAAREFRQYLSMHCF